MMMNRHLKRFLDDEAGATAIEYGLIAALIAVVLIASLNTKSTYDHQSRPPAVRKRCGPRRF